MNGDPLQPKPSGEPKSPAPAPEVVEDTGTQALSEALRASFVIIKIVMVGLVVLFLASGFFTVGTQERAVILRFGKPVGEGDNVLLGPGAHFAFPQPIDEVVKIPMGEVQTVRSTIGWYATTAAQEASGSEPPPGPTLNPATEGYLLTADENIIHVRATLRYRISEPGLRFIFGFNDGSRSVQDALNNAIVYAAAHFKVDDALTRDTVGFRQAIRNRLDELIRQQKLGITVDQIEIQSIPPRKLKEAFAAVLEAEVNKSKTINEARSYATETLNQARSQSSAITNAGQNAKALLIASVAAEAKRFEDLLPSYQKNPELFIEQHLTDTLQQVLTNAQEKWVVPQGVNGRPVEIRLQLNRQQEKPRMEAPAPTPEHH